MRAELSLAGWKPGQNPQAEAAEWWSFDFEYAYPPVMSPKTAADIYANHVVGLKF